MIEKVRKTIVKYRMLSEGENVLVAVSGGTDSMALLHILQRISPDFGVKLTVAHFNHGIRPESKREEEFVRKEAEEMGLPFFSGQEDVKALNREWKRSLEESARIARYRFLDEAAKKCGASKIALGHHKLDQAETVLINLIRGSGLAGLKGMEPVREGKYIRPLIHLSPREIASYVAREGIRYCTDRSNFDERFLRNRVRHRLIPLLEREFNPRVVEALSQMADILREEEEFIAGEARALQEKWAKVLPGEKIFSIHDLLNLPGALRKRIVKELLEDMKGEGKAVTFRHVEGVEKMLLSSAPGKMLSVPGGRVVKEYDDLRFRRIDNTSEQDQFSYFLPLPGETIIESTGQRVKTYLCDIGEIPKGPINPGTLYVDVRVLKPPLTVRSWRKGDRMVPLGMNGSRKVQDIFGEMKVPRAQRRLIPILEDAVGILWIGNLKVAERCRLRPDTVKVAKIEII